MEVRRWRSKVRCLSSFSDLDRLLSKEGLRWGHSSKVYAIRHTLKKLGSYMAQRVVKKLVQHGEFIWDIEEDFEVEAILDHTKEQFGREEIDMYLIKWKGWTKEHNTWEPRNNLECEELLEEFHRLFDAGASRAQIVAKMASLTHCDDFFGMHRKLGDLSERLAQDNILPSRLVRTAQQMCKRKGSVLCHPASKRKRTGLEPKRMVDITNKRTKAYRALKAEMEAALKQWEIAMNKADVNQAPITVENDVDLEGPPSHFTYTTNYIAGDGISIPEDPLIGCECESCIDEKKSCCGHNAGSKFAYYKNKRLRIPPGVPIYECNRYCKCGKDCPNRVVQLGRQHKVCLFRTSNGRGWGIKAMQKIKKGSFVVEYVGEVITHEEAERRGKIYDGAGRTYLFDLDYNDDDCPYTVDAGRFGNISHFINHSCDPNLAVYGVWINTMDPRLPRIALFAQKDISKGEELTFDYMMTADTTGGFGVRSQEALKLSQSHDNLSDTLSDTASESAERDGSSSPMSSTQSPLCKDAPDVSGGGGLLTVDMDVDSPAASGEDAMKPPEVSTALTALEVKAKVNTAEAMPPTPPPSETQEAQQQLGTPRTLPAKQQQQQQEEEGQESEQQQPVISNRVVCQCGARNCRGYLY